METDTLKAAKQHLRNNWNSGTDCPCCGQIVKLYKRKFNTIMARGLISLYHLCRGNQNYHHVSDIMTKISPTGSSDFSKLRYYGLIEEESNDDTAKKTSGNWKITSLGIKFVHQRIIVPEYLHIYNTKVRKFDGNTIGIRDALGMKFNYTELMNL